ncbi:hypothetical protein MRB53_007295 [Persea americana]|uniref:Uncharacterized protein n=1 Tax=Persea americana TaxID=3435 RepID=A0ACC2MIJ9_PERAE|nr:hypothetical protein MRB53_007295 [Persea americana]
MNSSGRRHRFKMSADHDNQQRDGSKELPCSQSRQPVILGCLVIAQPNDLRDPIQCGPNPISCHHIDIESPKETLKKFSHAVLDLATTNFSDDKKIGEGEFGSVYKGYLSDLNLMVDVKKIPRVSVTPCPELIKINSN